MSASSRWTGALARLALALGVGAVAAMALAALWGVAPGELARRYLGETFDRANLADYINKWSLYVLVGLAVNDDVVQVHLPHLVVPHDLNGFGFGPRQCATGSGDGLHHRRTGYRRYRRADAKAVPTDPENRSPREVPAAELR